MLSYLASGKVAGDRTQLVFGAVPPGESDKDEMRDASACDRSGSDSGSEMLTVPFLQKVEKRVNKLF